MVVRLRTALLLVGLLMLLGCDGGAAALPTTIHGAWLGQGTFRAQHGNAEVKAQLEVLPDGTYRFLILEPSILALAGVERGTWVREGDVLALTPDVEEATPPQLDADGKPSLMSALRATPRNFRPKSLTVAGDLSALTLKDGPLEVQFAPNAEATQKLREAGELD